MKHNRGGTGTQKKARFERLKQEIISFVTANHGCSAQSIVANLSHEKSMRNHGLTPRKVAWWQDHRAGRRVYGDRSRFSDEKAN